MLEGFDFTVSYVPVAGIQSLFIIISVSYSEVLIIFVLEISNAIKNNISPNPEEIFSGSEQKKIGQKSISIKKSEGIVHSGNKLNTRNKTYWKIML